MKGVTKMPEIDEATKYKTLLLNAWLPAIGEVITNVTGRGGRGAKAIFDQIYRKAVEYWLNALKKFNIEAKVKPGMSIKERIEAYIDTGVRSGLLHSASDYKLEELEDGSVKITVHNCPYKEACLKFIKDNNGNSDMLPCSRIGAFAAAVGYFDDQHEIYGYKIVKVDPSESCEGYIFSSSNAVKYMHIKE
jgi:hypothetical protein